MLTFNNSLTVLQDTDAKNVKKPMPKHIWELLNNVFRFKEIHNVQWRLWKFLWQRNLPYLVEAEPEFLRLSWLWNTSFWRLYLLTCLEVLRACFRVLAQLLITCLSFEGMEHVFTDLVLLNNWNILGIDWKDQNRDRYTKLNDNIWCFLTFLLMLCQMSYRGPDVLWVTIKENYSDMKWLEDTSQRQGPNSSKWGGAGSTST